MKQPRVHVWVANRRRFGPSSERKLSKYYGGYGFVEPQVPERGVEDRYLLDDFCMGIELTFDCVLARRTSYATSIDDQMVS